MTVSKNARVHQRISFPDGSDDPEDYIVFQPIPGWIAVACRLREAGLVRLSWHRDVAYDGPCPDIASNPARWEFGQSLSASLACDGLSVLDIGELSPAMPE